MSPNVGKRNLRTYVPSKNSINPRIRRTYLKASSEHFGQPMMQNFLHADNEDPDRTERMRRLTGVVIGGICPTVRFLTLRLI